MKSYKRVTVGCGIISSFALLLLASPTTAQTNDDPASLPAALSSEDLSGIQKARHEAIAIGDSFLANNPGQAWQTRFDGRGFTTRPDAGGWSWGLQLESYGFPGHAVELPESAYSSADSERVAYSWNENLEEWYVNDSRGLEHGYTLDRRPEQDQPGALTFAMGVRGNLQARILPSGKGVRFVDANEEAVLNYSGLKVLDADGQVLGARFIGGGRYLSIVIDEAQANYPLTIDPLAQQVYLKASNTNMGDYFGSSVSIHGDVAVVGAPFEDGSSSGVNGDQSTNGFSASGAAYVFRRVGTQWRQEAYLKASNALGGHEFGVSVAVSGDWIVVGAPKESGRSTGINGNQTSGGAVYSGAAYVFHYVNGVWAQEAYFKASNTDAWDSFAWSVSISGGTIVVGAPSEDGFSSGVNGDQNNNDLLISGAAYVFSFDGTAWSQEAYLKASNPGIEDQFGWSVSISGDTIVVGASREDSNATGINGDGKNDDAQGSGAAYVFERSNGTWGYPTYLKASNTDASDWFAHSVSISGDLLVAGAWAERSNATGIDGDQLDNSFYQAGAAYIFQRTAGTWSQQAYLKGSNTEAADRFGWPVAVSGNKIMVGATLEDSNSTGINGDQSNNLASHSGAAYLFEKVGNAWSQVAFLKSSNTATLDDFAYSLAISSDSAIVGAVGEDSRATGIEGDQSSNHAESSGAAYVFDLSATQSVYCSPGITNSTGSPAVMTSFGSIAVSDNGFGLHAEQLPSNVFGYFLSSRGHDYVASPGGAQGVLCLGGGAAIGRHIDTVRNSGGGGIIHALLDLNQIPTPTTPTIIQAGETWNFQCWYRDFNPNVTSNFSHGLSVRFE